MTNQAVLAPETHMTPAAKEAASSPWFALHVKSNCEKPVSAMLRGKGYEEYLPTCSSRRRWSDRVKEIEAPVFPGYVFCRIAPEGYLGVVTTPGVVGVVGVGRTPVPISEIEIAAVTALVRSSRFAQPWPYLEVGQKVCIVHGPLAGVEGILVSFKSGYRLVVSVGLLKRSVAAEVEGDWVHPL